MRKVRQVTGWHTESALALHRELPPDGDLPWSPYSVAAALGLAAAGARGRTLDELAGVLVPGADLAALEEMLTPAAVPAGAEVAVASAVWVDARLRLRPEYLRAVRDRPGGAARGADFHGDPDGSRSLINEDVAETTRGLVRQLLAPGTVTRGTAAVIVSALYLRAAWQHPFEAAATRPAAFHAPSGTRQVPTMRQQVRLRYAATAGWRMVTLPTDGDAEVDVLVPDDGADLARLTTATLESLHRAAAESRVDLALPRFRVEAALTLDEQLRRLGVVTAFSDAADFSGVADRAIAVDTVVHKTVLRVDEQGFEGAAATAVVMRLVSMEQARPVRFHVDRPFLVLVRHRSVGAIYFLARVAEP